MDHDHEAVFFDMDGVTVETASAWHEIEREHVLPNAVETNAETDDVLTEAIRGMNVDDAYDRLVSMEGVTLTVDRSGFDTLYKEKSEHVYHERAELMEGYHDLVSSLSSEGVSVGLVSASRRDWVEMVLERFGLRGVYDAVVSADDIEGPSKPDPATYEYAASVVGVAPEEAVAVEDTVHGISAAVGADMRCIAYRGDGNDDADLSRAVDVVGGPAELREALLG